MVYPSHGPCKGDFSQIDFASGMGVATAYRPIHFSYSISFCRLAATLVCYRDILQSTLSLADEHRFLLRAGRKVDPGIPLFWFWSTVAINRFWGDPVDCQAPLNLHFCRCIHLFIKPESFLGSRLVAHFVSQIPSSSGPFRVESGVPLFWS